MPNSIFKTLIGQQKLSTNKKKTFYPYTLAMYSNGYVFERVNGEKSFDDFPNAKFLNIVYRNGKVKVLKNKN